MIRPLIPVMLAATLAGPALAQARGDFRWEKALPGGNEVSIHNINGDIRVVPSTSGKVEVVGIKRGNDRYFDRIKADVHQTSRGISICVLYDDSDSYCDESGSHTNNRGWNSGRDRDWNNVSMNLEVAVPTNLIVSAGSVSGDVQMTGMQGDIQANSVSGDIRLDRLRASSVQAHSVSGDVVVRVEEFIGRGDLSFHTVSGDVTLELPRQLDVDLSMSTVSGGIDSDYALTIGGNGRMNRRSMDARIGSGGRRLDLATVSGDVKLRMIR
jgi:DUF4097 and DUF4098 domain-containing protein YvlB